MEFVVDKEALEKVFSAHSVSLPIIPPTAPHSSSIIRGGCNSPAVASVIVDSVQLHPKGGKN
jgi:hypothetical protein